MWSKAKLQKLFKYVLDSETCCFLSSLYVCFLNHFASFGRLPWLTHIFALSAFLISSTPSFKFLFSLQHEYLASNPLSGSDFVFFHFYFLQHPAPFSPALSSPSLVMAASLSFLALTSIGCVFHVFPLFSLHSPRSSVMFLSQPNLATLVRPLPFLLWKCFILIRSQTGEKVRGSLIKLRDKTDTISLTRRRQI